MGQYLHVSFALLPKVINSSVLHRQYVKSCYGVLFVQGRSEVVLCKKKLEDFTQRWVIAEDG